MAGTTYRYAGGNKAKLVYLGDTIRLDQFSVVEDIPGEAWAPIGSSRGDAASAGVVLLSGSFGGRLLNQKTGTSNQHMIMYSSNHVTPSSAVITIDTEMAYTGDIIITGMNYEVSGGAVSKVSGSFLACYGFNKNTLAT